MTPPTYDQILSKFPEHLSWAQLAKLWPSKYDNGKPVSVRTMKRWRAAGNLRGIVFTREPGGSLVAIKTTVIQFLTDNLTKTTKDLTPPAIRNAA